MAKGVVLSVALVVVWTVAQIVAVHVLRPTRMFVVLTALFAATVPIYVVLYAITPANLGVLPAAWAATPPALGLADGLLVHGLLYCTWMQGFYYVDRPVTLRLLVEFVKAPGGSLTLAQMRAVYGLPQMIERRLISLRDNGYVEERDGRFVLTPKGRLFARGIAGLRRALGARYYFVPADGHHG
jgi:hypothetical protein